MKPKLLLRIAAILMFLHTIGHTFGALSWKNAPNPLVGQVIAGMQKNHFEFMGRSATLASFYEGYGYMMILVLLLISMLLWLLAAESDSRLSSKLLPVLAVFLLLIAVIEYIYFFPFAAALTSLAGLCTLFSLVNRENKLNTLKN
jgi:hypothetical protein